MQIVHASVPDVQKRWLTKEFIALSNRRNSLHYKHLVDSKLKKFLSTEPSTLNPQVGIYLQGALTPN